MIFLFFGKASVNSTYLPLISPQANKQKGHILNFRNLTLVRTGRGLPHRSLRTAAGKQKQPSRKSGKANREEIPEGNGTVRDRVESVCLHLPIIGLRSRFKTFPVLCKTKLP